MSIELMLDLYLYVVGAFQFSMTAKLYSPTNDDWRKPKWWISLLWFILVPLFVLTGKVELDDDEDYKG